MKLAKRTLHALTVLAVLMAGTSVALGQATRTWVSGVGDDANPCSRTAPCKTFAGAISKTAAGGEIDALDPGGYGAVTITKSITIDGGGTFASILGAGTNAVNVNAGAADVVTLRNLSINGAGTGLNGIRFLSGAALHIENCVIFNFSQKGVDFEPGAASRLFIKNTIIRNCNNATNGGGILVKPAAGTANVTLEGTRLDGNLFGIRAEDRSIVTIRDSSAAGNIFNGFLAISSTDAVDLNLESCLASGNNSGATNGIQSNGAKATVRMSNVTVVGNAVGLFTIGGGSIISFGNNRIAGNTTDGAQTSTILQQ